MAMFFRMALAQPDSTVRAETLLHLQLTSSVQAVTFVRQELQYLNCVQVAVTSTERARITARNVQLVITVTLQQVRL